MKTVFTYAELIGLKYAMEEKIAKSERTLKEATHIDTIKGMREMLEDCLKVNVQTLNKIEQLISEY